MRKILTLVVVGLLFVSGCAMPGDKAHCGWTFSIIKPPTINTEGTVLIQGNPGTVEAHPMGNVSGPVTDGAWNHAPTQKLGAVPAPRPGASYRTAGPCEDGPTLPRLTLDEWQSICNAARNAPLPIAR